MRLAQLAFTWCTPSAPDVKIHNLTPIGLNEFVEDGLAVSTGALPFDQVAQNTHILIIPYEKVNHLLVERFRR